MPSIYVKSINFMAKLPQDFHYVFLVEKDNGNPVYFSEHHLLQYQKYIQPYRKDHFSIKDDTIYFSGELSYWWFVRLFKKPDVYKITYLTKKQCIHYKNAKCTKYGRGCVGKVCDNWFH